MASPHGKEVVAPAKGVRVDSEGNAMRGRKARVAAGVGHAPLRGAGRDGEGGRVHQHPRRKRQALTREAQLHARGVLFQRRPGP